MGNTDCRCRFRCPLNPSDIVFSVLLLLEKMEVGPVNCQKNSVVDKKDDTNLYENIVREESFWLLMMQ